MWLRSGGQGGADPDVVCWRGPGWFDLTSLTVTLVRAIARPGGVSMEIDNSRLSQPSSRPLEEEGEAGPVSEDVAYWEGLERTDEFRQLITARMRFVLPAAACQRPRSGIHSDGRHRPCQHRLPLRPIAVRDGLASGVALHPEGEQRL